MLLFDTNPVGNVFYHIGEERRQNQDEANRQVNSTVREAVQGTKAFLHNTEYDHGEDDPDDVALAAAGGEAAQNHDCNGIHFISRLPDPTYQETVETVLDGAEAYLREGMYVQTSPHAIEDFVLAKCARLAAEAVHFRVGGRIVYGTELMICHTEQHFDWAASKEQMSVRLAGSGPIVIPGGYGRLMSGYVVRTGKDGAHLMASLIASALGASCIEFYIEGRVAEGVTAMTFDEATHFCAVPHAAFASSAIFATNKSSANNHRKKEISNSNFIASNLVF